MNFANIINIITIENAISAMEEMVPFYAPDQMDLMALMEMEQKNHPFEAEKVNEGVEELEEEFSENFFISKDKAKRIARRKAMKVEKAKLHRRKERTGKYGNLTWHSDGFMASYAKEKYKAGNRRVRQTLEIPSGKGGYKRLNGKGIW